MTRASEFLLNFLVNSTWQTAGIFALAAVGTRLLRNCSAHYRHIVWLTALFMCLVAPVITVTQVVPTWSIAFRSEAVIASSETTQAMAATPDGDDGVAPLDHMRRRSSQVAVTATPREMRLIAAAYLLFLGLCAIRFVRLWTTKERLRRSVTFDGLTAPIHITLKRCIALLGTKNVRLARSSTARVPYTLGIRRPLIVLPDSFCGDVDQETLLSVIAHEMAHVRRRDFLTKLVCELVSLPISFHPLAFFIKRQIERERELACDELVTREVLRPETYARSLLRAADLSLLPVTKSVMLSVFDGRMLEKRIRQLTQNRLPLRSWTGRMITAVVSGTLGLSTVFGSAFGFTLRAPLELRTSDGIPAAVTVSALQEPVTDRRIQDRPPVASRSDSTSAQQLAQSACDAGRSRNVEAIPSLVAMLGDDRAVEPIACYTIGRWTPALDSFKHPSPGEQAALALASLGQPAFGPLMNQLDNLSAAARRNAAWAIGELTNMPPGERAPAIPQLVALLGDSDAWVRMAAARAIGEVKDRRASETLIVTLSDSDWRVRSLAAWALNEMKEQRAVTALCNLLLTDVRAEVRTAAAEALGEIASAQALPSLQQALNDPEAEVRAKATWAIAEIQ
jgi:beta-lactamase regulating signal transducer with metallopeptidase domain/HEAT repeat protein